MTSRRILNTELDELIPAGRNLGLKLPERDRAPKNTFPLDEILTSHADLLRALARQLRDKDLEYWPQHAAIFRNDRAMLKLALLYSDLIGGVLGIFGSLILAYPYISEITDRRHWELLIEFQRRSMDAHDRNSRGAGGI